ncbi:hypothetical protein [Nonomuraea rhodomycinica]|uniref:PknH-like extracellular domain-containing protein n=1 Tax=Nonomuraea rhodomycinica TaxID=1712872 RepID=A0A7Y6MAY5_9ACTN|nr:hypothetical protein [Nonomuraea rhodomycinica]NUW40340.1 hypothetical protein [Nonomuraea rhodomycinica]
MRRGLRIIGLTTAAALLAGCLAACEARRSGGHAGTYTTSRASVRSSVRLHALLERPQALPDGFSPRAGAAWRMPVKVADRDCRAVLEPAGGRAPLRALTGQAAVSYQGDELGEQVAVGLARYEGSEAGSHLDALAGSLAQCRTVRAPGGTRLRLRPLPVEAPGDEAVSARLRGKLRGYPYTMDVVLARAGDTLVSIVHTGMARLERESTERLVGAVLKMASA